MIRSLLLLLASFGLTLVATAVIHRPCASNDCCAPDLGDLEPAAAEPTRNDRLQFAAAPLSGGFEFGGLSRPERSRRPHPSKLRGKLPERLSEIGIVRIGDHLAPAAGGFDYTINYPLWSDGTDKERHAYLPKGSKIEVDDDGEWTFPDGAVFAKTFSAPGVGDDRSHARIETRVLYKHDGGWEMAAYEWTKDGGDALKTGGDDVATSLRLSGASADYKIPGSTVCLNCHGGAKDAVIGVTGFQLNAPLTEHLVAGGHLDRRALPLPHQQIDAENDYERRTLGYIGGNCAHCHNPLAPAYQGDELDLRPHRIKEETIGVAPERLYHPDAVILVDPGQPDASVLFRLFVHTFSSPSDSDRRKVMPPVGVNIVDSEGTALLRGWIQSLAKN